MIKLVAPWLLTLGLGFVVFLYGRYLQRREKEHRQEVANLRKHFEGQLGSALSTAEPTPRKGKGTVNTVQSSQGASRQVKYN
jgi:hypothetical protein